jgi:hypothetical protein
MSVRKLMTVAAAASFLVVAAPALPGSAAPISGCPTPANRPVLTLKLTPATVVATRALTAVGKLTQNSCGIRGATVLLQHRDLVAGKPSGKWATFATLTTNAKGAYSTTRAPMKNEQERAVFNGVGSLPTTFASVVTAMVKPRITFTATNPGKCQVHVSGATTPVKAGRVVEIQKRAPQGKFNGWTTLWTSVTNSKGLYSTTQTFSCGRTLNLSIHMYADKTNAAGRSHTIFGIKTTP